MNNQHNYADFIGMNLSENDSNDYQLELQQVSYSQEPATETPIEHLLLNHNKYHIYCE